VARKSEATDKLARAVVKARPSDLPKIYSELFPERPSLASPIASEIAKQTSRAADAAWAYGI
jgi:hypothetical protein